MQHSWWDAQETTKDRMQQPEISDCMKEALQFTDANFPKRV